MNKKNKGEFGYLNYKKKLNAIITAIALLVIIAIFATGLLIFKSRNNYMTLVATFHIKCVLKMYTTGLRDVRAI